MKPIKCEIEMEWHQTKQLNVNQVHTANLYMIHAFLHAYMVLFMRPHGGMLPFLSPCKNSPGKQNSSISTV